MFDCVSVEFKANLISFTFNRILQLLRVFINGLKRNLLEAAAKIFHGDPHKHNVMTTSREAEKSDVVTLSFDTFKMTRNTFILQYVSPYFKRMFRRPWKENASNVVDCKSVDQATLESLLKFSKSNTLKVDINNFQKILVAADYFLMCTLKLFSVEFLNENLDAS